MKTTRVYLLLAVLLASLSACGAPREAESLRAPAVGAIFIHDVQPLPENAKVYAGFEAHTYSFDLPDAACVYYFSPNEDVSYAGSQKFSALSFAANIDSDTVGAVGTIPYRAGSGPASSVAAYYLYYDEMGLYFETNAPFAKAEISDSCVLTGTAYSCEASFAAVWPTARFTLTRYDANHSVLSAEEYAPQDVDDNQKFELDDAVASVELVQYAADGSVLSTDVFSPYSASVVICYDNGGLILPSKALRLIWTRP